MERYVLTVSLNAAVDVAYVIPHFNAGKINIVSQLQRVAGGKANNCARVLAGPFGLKVVATGFAGGLAGSFIQSDLRAKGIEAAFEDTGAENRTCYAIVDPTTRAVSEIREKGPTLTPDLCDRFLVRFQQLLAGAALVVISGSLPPGVPVDFNHTLVSAARKAGLPVILDVAGQPLQEAVHARPLLIKPNREELEMWAGRPLPTRADLLEAACAIREAGPEVVILSLGEEGALLVMDGGIYQVIPPAVQAANTVGSGDSLVAGFAAGIVRGLSIEEAARLGVACGTANALTDGVAEVYADDLDRLLPQIRVERVGT